MSDHAAELLSLIGIKVKIIRQRRKWILKGMSEKDLARRDVAIEAFLKEIEPNIRRYDLKPKPPLAAHGGPKLKAAITSSARSDTAGD